MTTPEEEQDVVLDQAPDLEATPKHDQDLRFSKSIQQSASLAPAVVEEIGKTGKVPNQKQPKERRPKPEDRSGPVIVLTKEVRDLMVLKAEAIVKDKSNSYTGYKIEHDSVVVR